MSLTDDELIELAKKAKPVLLNDNDIKPIKKNSKVNFEKSPLFHFISKIDLKPGKNTVESKVIYELYMVWASENALPDRHFFIEFAKFFKSRKISGKRCYKLNFKSATIMQRIEELKNEEKADQAK